MSWRVMIVMAALSMAACGSPEPGPAQGKLKPRKPEAAEAAAAPVVSGKPVVLARLGDEVVTNADVAAAIAATPGAQKFTYANEGPLRELVETLVDRKLMAKEAVRHGLDKRPVTVKRLRMPGVDAHAKEQILAESYLVWRAEQQGTGQKRSEAELRDYYAAHSEEFTDPERVRITRVTLAQLNQAEKARDDLRQAAEPDEVLSRLKDANVSVDEIWLQRRPRMNSIEEAAFALPPGGVSEALPQENRFVVLRLKEREPAVLRPFAEVRDSLESRMSAPDDQLLRSLVREELRAQVPVAVDDAALVAFRATP